MDNLIHLFNQHKPTPAKDVSTETYFFTFAGTEFHFGGGAFTRDLLERLNAHRDAVKQLVSRETQLKLDAIAAAAADFDADTKTMLETAVRLEDDCKQSMIDHLHTPNDLDDFLSDDQTLVFMPFVLAATIHAAYVPFDLLRMQRANWCLFDRDATDFMTALDSYFTQSSKEFVIIRYPEGSQS